MAKKLCPVVLFFNGTLTILGVSHVPFYPVPFGLFWAKRREIGTKRDKKGQKNKIYSKIYLKLWMFKSSEL